MSEKRNISFWADQELFDMLESFCVSSDQNKSDVIRDVLWKWINDNGSETHLFSVALGFLDKWIIEEIRQEGMEAEPNLEAFIHYNIRLLLLQKGVSQKVVDEIVNIFREHESKRTNETKDKGGRKEAKKEAK